MREDERISNNIIILDWYEYFYNRYVWNWSKSYDNQTKP